MSSPSNNTRFWQNPKNKQGACLNMPASPKPESSEPEAFKPEYLEKDESILDSDEILNYLFAEQGDIDSIFHKRKKLEVFSEKLRRFRWTF